MTVSHCLKLSPTAVYLLSRTQGPNSRYWSPAQCQAQRFSRYILVLPLPPLPVSKLPHPTAHSPHPTLPLRKCLNLSAAAAARLGPLHITGCDGVNLVRFSTQQCSACIELSIPCNQLQSDRKQPFSVRVQATLRIDGKSSGYSVLLQRGTAGESFKGFAESAGAFNL